MTGYLTLFTDYETVLQERPGLSLTLTPAIILCILFTAVAFFALLVINLVGLILWLLFVS